MGTSELQFPPAGNSATTSVASSTSSVTILAANTNRLGAAIHNDSNVRLFLRLATGAATTTNFTAKVEAGEPFEVPSGYTGIISGIWSPVVSGSARITEFTP